MPALSLVFSSGNLSVQGVPTGTLTIEETGVNAFEVRDGLTSLGSYLVTGNINVRLSLRPSDIDIDLNATGLAGNLFLDLGVGDPIGLPSAVNIHGGSIGGSLTLRRGSGNETYNLGIALGGAADPLTVGTDVYVTAVRSTGMGIGSPRDTLILETGSTISRNLTTSFVDSILLVDGSAVGGSVTNNASQELPVSETILLGSVGRNVTVVGPATGSTVTLGTGLPGDGVIGGNLTVNAPGGMNSIALTTDSLVSGSATIVTGGSADIITLAGEVDGSVSLLTGNGGDAVTMDATASVFGNLQISSGNGDNLLTLDGLVAGQLYVTLGSGDNIATISNPPAGRLNWTSGNGDNLLTLGTAASPPGSLWWVNIRFGNGDDTLTLDAAAPADQFITGLVDFAGQGIADEFNQGASWILTPTFILIGLP